MLRNACRVGEVVRVLRDRAPEGHILLQGLLPRGSSFLGAAQWKWPNRYTKPLAAVNAGFQARLHASLFAGVYMGHMRHA